MKTFVITIIWETERPEAYEVQADSRSEALRVAWSSVEGVADHVVKITAVLK